MFCREARTGIYFPFMKNASSRIPAVIARIALVMFVFGLLSQSAQACLLPTRAIVGAVVSASAGVPCDTAGTHADAHPKCASNHQVHADVCFAQASMLASHGPSSSSPAPVAVAVEPNPVSLVKPRRIIGSAVPPRLALRPPIPLSILHCSFQI